MRSGVHAVAASAARLARGFDVVREASVRQQQCRDDADGVGDREADEDRRHHARVELGDLRLRRRRRAAHRLRGEGGGIEGCGQAQPARPRR